MPTHVTGRKLIHASRSAVATGFVLGIMLTCVGGCAFGPCETPGYMLPVIIATAPFSLTANAIDDHSPNRSNSDFVLAGVLLDDLGQPVDSVRADITAWIATHRNGGVADRWEQRRQQLTLDSTFRLDVKNAQTLEIVWRRSGYRDQRVVFANSSVHPPFVHIREETYQRWQFGDPRPVINTAQLEGGGTFFAGSLSDHPVRKEDFRIVMEPNGRGSGNKSPAEEAI
jgi:hypothetical protein